MGLSLIPKRNQPPRAARSLPRLPGFEFVGSVFEHIMATARVGLAYGEPVTVGGRTIIPVGAVGYGFGGGFGGGRGHQREQGAGGGVGGGVTVQPVAFIEIAGDRIRVRPVLDWTRITVAVAAVAVPLLLRRWRWQQWEWRRRRGAVDSPGA